MSTKITVLTVPATPGFGAASDISDLVGEKTVQLAGTFSGSYVLYVSHDGSGYAPVLSFDSGGPEPVKKTFAGAFRYAKILSRASGSSGVAASISGLEDAGANTFAAETIPAGHSGVSPVEDLGLVNYQQDFCTIVSGSFAGEIVLEGSMDGTRFNPLGSWRSQPPQAGLLGPSALEFSPIVSTDKVRYLRATVLGTTTTAVTLTVGGSQSTEITSADRAVIASAALLISAITLTGVNTGALELNDKSLRVTGTVTGGKLTRGIYIGSAANIAGQVSLRGSINGDYVVSPGVYGFHGFEDYSSVNMSGAQNAYASAALSPLLTGTSNWDHGKAVQAWAGYNSTGTMGAFYGVDILSTLDGGVVSDNYGIKINTPGGAGVITRNYAIYIAPQNRSATSYTIYAAGNEPSKHFGDLRLGDASQVGTGILQLTKKILFCEDSQSKFGDAGIVAGGAPNGHTAIEYFSTNTLIIRRGNNVAATFGADSSLTLASLAGVGSRAVVADAAGKLSAP